MLQTTVHFTFFQIISKYTLLIINFLCFTRYYLYYWLERETHVLRELGDYKYNNENSMIDTSLLQQEQQQQQYSKQLQQYNDAQIINKTTPTNSFNERNSSFLHEQVMEDQRSFHDKIERLNRRKEWLRSNELLLRTFLSYCSLHSAKGGPFCIMKVIYLSWILKLFVFFNL